MVPQADRRVRGGPRRRGPRGQRHGRPGDAGRGRCDVSPAAAGLPVAGSTATPLYLDTSYSFAERAADLVSCMTLSEKVGQLQTNNAPAIPRLGVQQYTYWSEGQHGVNRLGADTAAGGQGELDAQATSFPVNFASTMSWDPSLVYQETTAISDEARGFLDKSLYGTGENNLGPSASDYGSLTYWAPTVNMDRDPRWGRTDEAFGEDPYLASAMSDAFVDGYQGETMSGQLDDAVPEGRGHRQALRAEQRGGRPAHRQLGHHRRQHPRLLHQAVPEPGGERARLRDHDLLQRDQRHAVAGRHLHDQRTAPAHLRVRRVHHLGLRRGRPPRSRSRRAGTTGRRRAGPRPTRAARSSGRTTPPAATIPAAAGGRGLRAAGGYPAQLHRRRGDGDEHRGRRSTPGLLSRGRDRQRPDAAVHHADGDRRVRPGQPGRLHQASPRA